VYAPVIVVCIQRPWCMSSKKKIKKKLSHFVSLPQNPTRVDCEHFVERPVFELPQVLPMSRRSASFLLFLPPRSQSSVSPHRLHCPGQVRTFLDPGVFFDQFMFRGACQRQRPVSAGATVTRRVYPKCPSLGEKQGGGE
jgi:hypothetical protein